MDKRLSVYIKYGEKADNCSTISTVCPNHFEMCPIRVIVPDEIHEYEAP